MRNLGTMTKEDYMKLDKERLAELLAQKDLEDDFGRGIYRGLVPTTPVVVNPINLDCFHGGPCTNPHHDCINCPRQYTGGGGVYQTSTSSNNINTQN